MNERQYYTGNNKNNLLSYIILVKQQIIYVRFFISMMNTKNMK